VSAPIDLSFEDGSILPSQYNDLYRRPRFDGEHRLLWAVLEEAIRNYLANADCSTPNQRTAFQEVCNWFQAADHQLQGPFSFESICDLLQIDSGLLLKGLESIRASDLPKRRDRSIGRTTRVGRLAT
jgi:hypothetical protein